MDENNAIRQKKGKWSEKGVPHKDWTCIDIEDLGEPLLTCEMCDSQIIRYVHYMSHPNYATELKVGCDCAGHMEGNLLNAHKRDNVLKSRSAKRKRWLTRKWQISQSGNEYF
jgi:hypothetical protein